MRAGQGLREHLERGMPVVWRARPGVEAVGDAVEFILAEDAKVGALGQVLPDEPVRVLASATLPGTVRVAEVDLHAGLRGQFDVPRHLLALVVGEAPAQRRSDRIELGREARQRRGCSGVIHLGQQHQAARAFDQHAHRGLVAGALDEVALPVARHDAVVHLGWAHMDADHVGDLPAPVLAPRARHAGAATVAQAGHELLAQLSPRLRLDGRVDGLVRDVPLRFVGEHALERSGYLLRRPLPVQQCAHRAPAHTVEVELACRPGGHPPARATQLRGVRAVRQGLERVALELTRDRRWAAAQRPGHGPGAEPLQLHACHRHPVLGLKLAVLRRLDHVPHLTLLGVALQF